VSASPAAAAFGVVGRAAGKALKGELSDGDLKRAEVNDSLTALGLITGLPTGSISKPINYYRDVQSGEARPTGPLDALRGAVTGKPGVK